MRAARALTLRLSKSHDLHRRRALLRLICQTQRQSYLPQAYCEPEQDSTPPFSSALLIAACSAMSLRLYSPASLGLGPAFLRVASLRLPSYAQSQGIHQLACSSSVAELRHVDSASLLRGHRNSSAITLSCHPVLSSRSKSYRKSGTQRKPAALWSGPVSIAIGLAGFGLFDKGREEVHCGETLLCK